MGRKASVRQKNGYWFSEAFFCTTAVIFVVTRDEC